MSYRVALIAAIAVLLDFFLNKNQMFILLAVLPPNRVMSSGDQLCGLAPGLPRNTAAVESRWRRCLLFGWPGN